DFKANCFLPAGGIKPAFIEGKSYVASSGVSSHVRKAPQSIPDLDNSFLDNINLQFNSNSFSDSLVYELSDNIHWKFSQTTILHNLTERKLSNKSWSGNIVLRSNDVITIDSTCHLDKVLIVARKVVFNEGFKGKVHVVASDSIICNEKTNFLFPSSMVIYNKEASSSGLRLIQFSEESSFFGGIVAYTESKAGEANCFVKFSSTSDINGSVYSSGYVHMEGNFNANVIARKLLIKTPSAAYENHILSCQLNPAKYAGLISIPFLFKKSSDWRRCERI
ncbi:MAG: hypothetical protein AB7O73_07655, partial [Bacteroidia bacterium]